MNIVLEQLNKKQDLQIFLQSLLDYLQSYFQNVSQMPEHKTYQTIQKISSRIYKYFPHLHSIHNLTLKLIINVQEQISDKYQNIPHRKIIGENLKALIAEIDNLDIKSTLSEEQQSDYSWVRKALLKEISLLKQDIQQAEDILANNLKQLIPPNSNVVFMDSYLSNWPIVHKLTNTNNLVVRKVVIVRDEPLKQSQIDILEAIVLSGEGILKDGSVLAPSGSLLLASVAYAYHIPVIVISRSYCLMSRIILGQSNLHIHNNPLNYFQMDSECGQKVYIAKHHDVIQPKFIHRIHTELGECLTGNVQIVIKKYYS